VAQDGFAIDQAGAYIGRMVRNKLELPPAAARAFVKDMRAFYAAKGHEADAIAAQQLHALRQHYKGKLRLTDIKEMFEAMRDQA
jgi:hypothetical protein